VPPVVVAPEPAGVATIFTAPPFDAPVGTVDDPIVTVPGADVPAVVPADTVTAPEALFPVDVPEEMLTAPDAAAVAFPDPNAAVPDAPDVVVPEATVTEGSNPSASAKVFVNVRLVAL
jgi:hypothetical protein